MPRIALPAGPLTDGPTALRPWRDADIPALVAVCQDPEIARWTRVPAPYGETDARLFLLERHDGLLKGTRAPFAIVSPTDQAKLLGSVALMRFAWEHRRAEVGYFVAREARGAGHATRAVRLICDWGFAELGLERIELLASTGNRASQGVADRAGFRREALLRAYLCCKDGRDDMVVFGLLAGER